MTDPQVGAFGVVRTNGFVAWAIRWLTRSVVNHAFIFVGGEQIVEANPTGVGYGTVSEYDQITWYDKPLTPAEAATIVATAKGRVGTPYGFLDIAALALACRGFHPLWVRERLQWPGTTICSQLVAECYTAAGIALAPQKRPWQVTPGDLWDVQTGAVVPTYW